MKALVFHDVGQVRYVDTDDPQILAATDAIVRVSHCGICGSDLHIYEGREVGIEPGTVFGHELVGEVVELGSSVSTLQPGDIVTAPFTTNCGECVHCKSGLTARCVNGQLFGWVENGEGLHGSHSELVRVPFADGTLMRLPAEVPAELGVLLGDNLSTAFFCVAQADLMKSGVNVVVGCGTVGSLAVMAAKHKGAECVVAVDGVPWRRERAKAAGADAVCSPEEAVNWVQEKTKGLGASSVMEAVGSIAAQRLAFDLVQAGGTISTVGVHTDPGFSFSPVEAYNRNLTYRIGRCSARHYMEIVVPLIGQLNLSTVITHEMALSEGANAYKMFADRADGVGKIILRP